MRNIVKLILETNDDRGTEESISLVVRRKGPRSKKFFAYIADPTGEGGIFSFDPFCPISSGAYVEASDELRALALLEGLITKSIKS